jgi:hypothetical protein
MKIDKTPPIPPVNGGAVRNIPVNGGGVVVDCASVRRERVRGVHLD